jgi:dCTP deaminase
MLRGVLRTSTLANLPLDLTSDPTLEPTHATETSTETLARAIRGVLPSQGLWQAVSEGWISSGDYRIRPESIQPASIDLRLADHAWALRCSFLPSAGTRVMDRVEDDLALDQIDLRDGATLERDRPYLIPLVEELNLPSYVRAKANPKSSTGRLDVFTRVITDGNHRFDEIPAGYQGKLYLEVVPRSFAVRVRPLLSLNQLRLAAGDPRVSDSELTAIHTEFPLLYMDKHALPAGDLAIADGLFLSVDLSGPHNRIVGYRAKKNSNRLDMSKLAHYRWRDYWEPVYPEAGGRIVLDPEIFYLLLSAEGVSVPPQYAAEMMAYDPTAGELRTHYAGFFDPGFGYDASGHKFGSRAALEVRARDVPFMVEHRQPICKLAFEAMLEPPDKLYGAEVGSSYQGQETTLSKHFVEQTAPASRSSRDAAPLDVPPLFSD